MVTAYFLCHGHWTVIPHQLDESFADMADCGFDAVAMSFSESEMRYSRRAFELQIGLAKKRGLRCLVVPSRLGGRLAGAPFAPSWWLASHPECMVPGSERWPAACVESPAFEEWISGFMTTLVRDYDLDGIIWDEPKSVGLVSTHPDTLARLGPSPTPEAMMESFAGLLGRLTAGCLEARAGLSVTLFAQKTDPPQFTSRAAAIRGLEFFGYDGNLARQSYFHEPPRWEKYRVESVWERTRTECAAAGVGTFALVENMLMPAEALGEYEANLDRYLAGPLPDHLGIYYYAHNNEAPERVHDITRRMMRKHLTRRGK